MGGLEVFVTCLLEGHYNYTETAIKGQKAGNRIEFIYFTNAYELLLVKSTKCFGESKDE